MNINDIDVARKDIGCMIISYHLSKDLVEFD